MRPCARRLLSPRLTAFRTRCPLPPFAALCRPALPDMQKWPANAALAVQSAAIAVLASVVDHLTFHVADIRRLLSLNIIETTLVVRHALIRGRPRPRPRGLPARVGFCRARPRVVTGDGRGDRPGSWSGCGGCTSVGAPGRPFHPP